MVFICHAEKAIYGERNDMDPEINKREVLNAGGKTQSFMVMHWIYNYGTFFFNKKLEKKKL